MHIKRFCMSGSAFWGWHTDIDLDDMNGNEDIIRELKARMLIWIKNVELLTEQNDLYGLRRAVEDHKYHFHGMTFEELLLGEDSVIYICHIDHTSEPECSSLMRDSAH
jgi:hypothetical protein